MKKFCCLVLALLLLLITPVAAAETINETVDGDKHIITIYDEGSMIARVFDQPGDGWSDIYIEREQKNRIDRLVIHRDIGDLDHIIFASDQIVPTGYDRVDEVPITVYWDPTYVDRGFPSEFNGTYVGSGTMYAYSNSITQEGHLTLIFDDWDSSIYEHHQDIRIFCWIDAARPLNFSTIRMGDLGGEVTVQNPVNDDVVCSLYGLSLTSGKRGFRYGTSTHVYTTGGIFEHEIHYSYLTPEILDVEIHRSVAGTQYGSMIKIFSSNQTEPYFIDNTATSVVRAHLPPSEAPFVVEIYSPSTDKTYTTTICDDSLTPPPTDPDGSGITVYIKNSQTGALIADANIVIDALVDGDYYPVTNRTEPSGIFTITLQPTGGGKPNPDGYRLIVTADGYNNPMPEINFTLGDYRKYFECFLDPIAGGPADENKTFIDFFVRDMSSNPISGATVKFGKYTLITNSAGYTVFEVDKNNNYSWTVSKSGYGALTGNAVIGDDPRHTINTVLAPIVTPTSTTPIPTSPPIGPTPTMTAPTGEPVSNWLEWFAAHFGMILGGGVEIGKIFMWLCFTVPVGVYVGKESKAGAAGFMAGAGIVTLFFVLIGWVPIWLVVLMALVIGLLYAKVFNTADNGGGR